MKNKHKNFIVKKALIFYIVLSIVAFVFVDEKWFVMSGLAIGGVFSLLRLNVLTSVLASVLLPEAATSTSAINIVKYILNQIALIIMLAAAAKFNLWFFIGMVAGVLLIPIIIFINGITEGFGITHNNFE